MNNKKIKHPYQVPDHFFDDFRNEMLTKIDAEPQNQKLRLWTMTILRYAAIIVISFILGRESFSYFQQQKSKRSSQDIYIVETVLSQVSDDDIIDYLIENVSEDFLQKQGR